MTEAGEADRLRRDVGWNLVPLALLAIVGLGLKFFIGGRWGEAALGSFNLVTIAFLAFAVLGPFGLQYSVLRAIAEGPDDRDRVAAIVVGALVPNTVLAAATTAVFLALSGPIARLVESDAVAEGMAWAAPGLFCFGINKVLLCVVNGLRRMRAFAVYTSLRYLLIAVGLGLAGAWGLEADRLPAIWSFVEGTLLLVLTGELASQVSWSRRHGWLAWSREHLGFGARGVLATLASEVNPKLDVWMVGVAMTDAQVGIYSLASALNEGAMQLAVVLQNNLNPVIARDLAGDKRAEVEALAKRTRRWFVPALVAVCAISAASYPLIVPWLIGNATFVDGAVPFAILMAGLALASRYLPFTQILLMAGRPGWHTIYVLAIVMVHFGGNVVLIPAFGLSGAGLALATSVVASAVFLRVFARWRLGVRL